jgi:hypothetical protein
MKISRRGSTADHGLSSVELPSPAFAWVKSDSCLTVKQSYVKDFSTKAHHSYTIRLTVPELNEILKSLAAAALADPASFERSFEPSLKALFQLQSVAAGIRT